MPTVFYSVTCSSIDSLHIPVWIHSLSSLQTSCFSKHSLASLKHILEREVVKKDHWVNHWLNCPDYVIEGWGSHWWRGGEEDGESGKSNCNVSRIEREKSGEKQEETTKAMSQLPLNQRHMFTFPPATSWLILGIHTVLTYLSASNVIKHQVG